VKRLEQAYRQTLFRREGMQMAPSPAALALARAYREAAHIVDQAGEELMVRDGEVTLVLSTLPSIAKLWLGPRLQLMREALPDLTLQVRTDRALANLHSDGVDLALRVGLGQWPNVRAELLFDEYVFPACSPEFLERHPAVADKNFADAPLIREDVDLWPAWFAAAGVRAPVHYRGPVFDDSGLTVEAAAAGLGVALVRRLHAQQAIGAGRLVRIGAVSVKDPYSCYLVWRDNNPRIAAIRRLADWVMLECDRAGLLQAA
jgi:DNA-binding transcriptional LysR family regulator